MNNYEIFSEEERRKLFELINTSSKKAHNLLDNLLLWSRTQTGALKTKPETFDINDLIRENADLLASSAKEKDLAIEFHPQNPLFVTADKNMISAVLRNLINNAIKFTSESPITISARRAGSQVEVAVVDKGIGMSPEALNNLFVIDRYKSTPGTAKEKGSGLGLIICKEFVEKNGGEIKVKSMEGKGSVFSFTLPQDSTDYRGMRIAE